MWYNDIMSSNVLSDNNIWIGGAGMSLIVIDGLDGCGKSTQLERLKSIYNDGKTTFISFPDYEMEVMK